MPASLGKYELLERIGDGGMAEVFRARMPGVAGFEKIVVIKRILPHLADKPRIVEMFVAEAKLAAQVQHKNVVQVFELAQTEQGEFFMVMELVSGTDLRKALRDATRASLRLPPWFSVHVAAEILDALSFAHQLRDEQGRYRNIVHRDVTPSNIFISHLAEVKLGDFGIAHDDLRESQTKFGQLKGKIGYMSPEQVRSTPLDGRSDVFAVGVVLWECLAQRRLFGGRPDFEAMTMICNGQRSPIIQHVTDVPPELDLVVHRALEADRERRYRDAREFQLALLDVLPQLHRGIRPHHLQEVVDGLLGRRALESVFGPMPKRGAPSQPEVQAAPRFNEPSSGFTSQSSASSSHHAEPRPPLRPLPPLPPPAATVSVDVPLDTGPVGYEPEPIEPLPAPRPVAGSYPGAALGQSSSSYAAARSPSGAQGTMARPPSQPPRPLADGSYSGSGTGEMTRLPDRLGGPQTGNSARVPTTDLLEPPGRFPPLPAPGSPPPSRLPPPGPSPSGRYPPITPAGPGPSPSGRFPPLPTPAPLSPNPNLGWAPPGFGQPPGPPPVAPGSWGQAPAPSSPPRAPSFGSYSVASPAERIPMPPIGPPPSPTGPITLDPEALMVLDMSGDLPSRRPEAKLDVDSLDIEALVNEAVESVQIEEGVNEIPKDSLLAGLDVRRHSSRISDHARQRWAAYGMIGEAYAGPHPFYLTDNVGNQLGPVSYDQAMQLVRAEVKARLGADARISVDSKDWMTLKDFGTLSAQENLLRVDEEEDLPKGTFQGLLEKKSLISVLSGIARSSLSGRLIVAEKGYRHFEYAEISVKDGLPVNVYVTDDALQIPELMVVKGVVRKEVMPDLMSELIRSRRPLVELVRQHLGVDVRAYFPSFMKERFVYAFARTTGRFIFEAGVPPPRREPLARSMFAVMPDAVFRGLSAETLRGLVDRHTEAKLEPSERFVEALRAMELTPPQYEWAVRLTKGKKISQLLRGFPEDERLILTMAFVLIESDLLRPSAG
jgi:serine/threonine protein kinase